jgi:hypothetical protein
MNWPETYLHALPPPSHVVCELESPTYTHKFPLSKARYWLDDRRTVVLLDLDSHNGLAASMHYASCAMDSQSSQ